MNISLMCKYSLQFLDIIKKNGEDEHWGIGKIAALGLGDSGF